MSKFKKTSAKIGMLFAFAISLIGLPFLNGSGVNASQNCAYNIFKNDGYQFYEGEDCFCLSEGNWCVVGPPC